MKSRLHTVIAEERCCASSLTLKAVPYQLYISGAGEAYDKVARLLGLDLNPSGGAAVEALAREGDDQRFKFSPPLRQKPNCNFSYAGLKTAVRLAIEAEVPDPPSEANRQVRPCCDSEPCMSMCPNAILNVRSRCASRSNHIRLQPCRLR